MMSKIYDEVGNPELSDQFLLCTFLFAFGFCVVFLLTRRQGIGRMEVLFGVLLAFPNYYSARFLLRAVTSVPAVVAYPTYSVGAIVMISAAGILFFHERISRRQKIAIAGILAALVLLNI
jgi:multidrug transporter EmrE-like cation transporter